MCATIGEDCLLQAKNLTTACMCYIKSLKYSRFLVYPSDSGGGIWLLVGVLPLAATSIFYALE